MTIYLCRRAHGWSDRKFTVAMGDDDMTTFELFQTPGFTKFEVEGTYTAAADGTFSFSLPDEDMDGVPDLTAFVVEPPQRLWRWSPGWQQPSLVQRPMPWSRSTLRPPTW